MNGTIRVLFRKTAFASVIILALASARGAVAQEATPKSGTTFKDCADCPEMVVVPAGSFDMGSATGSADEKPVHRVTLRSFALGKFEVTFAQWDACVADGGCGHRPNDRGWGRGSRPVMNVSWLDAQAYVRWLSRKSGKNYRMPSEAEWEYAARAGSRTAYWWGNEIGRDNANCWDCNTRFGKSHTVPVGSFKPNRFGIHDMHGNLREWVEDCSHKSYVGAPTDGSAWTTGGDCSQRIFRGGSYSNEPKDLTSWYRNWFPMARRESLNGFRVARDLQ